MATSFLSQKPLARVIWQRVKALLREGRSGVMTLWNTKGKRHAEQKDCHEPQTMTETKKFFLASYFHGHLKIS